MSKSKGESMVKWCINRLKSFIEHNNIKMDCTLSFNVRYKGSEYFKSTKYHKLIEDLALGAIDLIEVYSSYGGVCEINVTTGEIQEYSYGESNPEVLKYNIEDTSPTDMKAYRTYKEFNSNIGEEEDIDEEITVPRFVFKVIRQ